MNKYKPFAKTRAQYVINLISPKKSDRILNIGISNIPEIEMILENSVKECWTADIDKKKLENASKYLKKTRLLNKDVTKEIIRENYFDKVVVLEVFEHLKDDLSTMKSINRQLKKDGRIILSVPNDHPLHIINPVKYAEHERHYSNKLINNRLKDSGFKVEHFNIVENWRLLFNLYVHLFFKYILKKSVPFGFIDRKYNKTYMQYNRSGLDIIISAKKI
jgi:SAM-dependent methyltransferase